MKKRSLFVATAMLLVAVLVATGATYAWFTDLADAKATVQMDVANGQSLELRVGESAWVSSLDNTLMGIGVNDIWSDYSTTDDAFANEAFFTDHYFEEGQGQTNTIDKYVTGSPVKVAVQFRSSVADPVYLSGSFALTDSTTGLLSTLRVGVADVNDANGRVIYADSVNDNYTTAINKADVVGAEGLTGKQTVNAFVNSAKDTCVTLSDGGDGFYYGAANFYFWVEGPLCYNSMTVEGLKATATMTFAQ